MREFRLVLALVLALWLSGPAYAQGADRLVGIWGTALTFGPELHGELAIKRGPKGWSGAIGGLRATAAAKGESVRLDFSGRGSFRGTLRKGVLSGFWIQPGGQIGQNPDPGGAAQSFATPVQLRRVGPGTWRATVVPLDNRFTLWLSIFRGPDGTLTAAFRNPEYNSRGGAPQFQVEQKGSAIRFVTKSDSGETALPGELLAGPDRIRLTWPDLAQTVELVRRPPLEAAGFFPRPPSAGPYAYRPPPQLADGWSTARASDTGIDESVLQAAVREIAASDPAARRPTLMHSILVAHRAKLVLEEYFYGFDRSVPHDIRSAGKTFGSVMLGTPPAQRAGLSPQTRIFEVMRPMGPFANPDNRKSRITLADLMAHTSGLACNDNDDNSPGNEGKMQSQRAEPNWWRYTLNLPQQFAPGGRYAYCSAGSNLVGGALTQATDGWLPDLFRRTVAEPLQFGRWHWNLMANGEGYLGGGAYLLPRDLLKVGQAYLNGGIWNGRRIVTAGWVRESTKTRIDVSPQTTGLSEEEFSNFYGRGQDALAWHLGELKAGTRVYPTYMATGNGGQVLLVVPDAELAVVFTGANYGQGGIWTRWGQQFVGDKIIPAIRPRS